ncbi:hypothetical protein RHGRI_029594 [Rhododendron griersonianum]|uniref:EF-hand domain-containing protein n=1 Tax=Rhododendron griersonianum TaxID=479676 RepID=A0AAV6IKM0_9ERIC|nr:hypothetical protein RHGRI_029594 [Rhododendron griersonianum]
MTNAVTEIDKDGDGAIDLEEFTDLHRGGGKSNNGKAISDAFKLIKSLPDLLREYNLPPGLFPSKHNRLRIRRGKRQAHCVLALSLGGQLQGLFHFLRYTPRVKGTLSRGKLSGIEGMKTKALVWVKVTGVVVESYKSEKVLFVAGVKKSRPKDAMLSK